MKIANNDIINFRSQAGRLRSVFIAALFIFSSPLLFAGPIVVDFNSLGAGQIIDDQYDTAEYLGLRIAVRNFGGGPNLAVAFDSENYTGGDADLASPWDGGNLSSNDALGKMLIIQEDGYNDNGFISNGDPDDEAGGGKVIFRFDTVINEFGFDTIDTEESGYYLKFYNDGVNVTGGDGRITWNELMVRDTSIAYGNNFANRIAPISTSEFGIISSFDKVVIRFAGSGAIDTIVYQNNTAAVPEPSEYALMSIAIIAVIMNRRKRKRPMAIVPL